MSGCVHKCPKKSKIVQKRSKMTKKSFQKFPKTFRRVRMYWHASQCIRMCPKASMNVQKHRKTYRKPGNVEKVGRHLNAVPIMMIFEMGFRLAPVRRWLWCRHRQRRWRHRQVVLVPVLEPARAGNVSPFVILIPKTAVATLSICSVVHSFVRAFVRSLLTCSNGYCEDGACQSVSEPGA